MWQLTTYHHSNRQDHCWPRLWKTWTEIAIQLQTGTSTKERRDRQRKRKIVVECNSLKFFWFFKGNTVNVNCLQWLLQKLYWYHTFVQASKRPSVCLSFCSGNWKRIFICLKVLFFNGTAAFCHNNDNKWYVAYACCNVVLLFFLIFKENLHDFCNVFSFI